MKLGISEVIENLYISGLESNASILNKGIRSVFNISSECPIQNLGSNVHYEKIPIFDLPTTSIQIYFDQLTDRIEQNLRQGIKTLVHCYVGRSRSASIILAYLMKYKHMSLREAFYYLRSRRSIIGPNFGFIKQLIAYEKSLFGSTSVSFIETAYGSVPDIYLSINNNNTSKSQRERTIPIQITKNVSSTRPTSFVHRSTSMNTNSRSAYQRPISSFVKNSSFIDDQPQFHTMRLNVLRTGKYVPTFFNRLNFS